MYVSKSMVNTVYPILATYIPTYLRNISQIVICNAKKTFEHPIYAGNAIETVRVLDETNVLTIRTTAFDPAQSLQEPCPIERIGQ